MIPPKPIKKPIDFLAIIKRLQSALTKQEQKYTNQVIEAYTKSYKTIQPYIRNVELLIAAKPDITQTGIKRSREYHDLIDVTEKELNSFVDYARTTIGIAISASALLALNSVSQWGMTPVSPDALEVVTRFLQPDTALYDRIGLWTGNSREGVIQSILEGVGLGKNPRTIAQEITRAFGTSLTDAVRTTRTAQLWAARESTRLGYLANGIGQWVWMSTLDDSVCEVCLSEHGTIHDSSESLNGHYNCRCAMIPINAIEAIDQSGQDFFDSLSEEQQNNIMGNSKADAYREGKFAFSDLIGSRDDPVYGEMVSTKNLEELIGEE
jgi:SPP1 gp7 family putative phage head morphogenesis protein